MDINRILKVIFILSAIVFLVTMMVLPRNNCETCRIQYKGLMIDGIQAWKIFETNCISYSKPYNTQDIDINNITLVNA